MGEHPLARLCEQPASLILVCIAPVLGAFADQLGAKKRFLLLFAVLGVLATGGLY